MVSLMLSMCSPTFGSGKYIVLDSKFCVAKGITDLEVKGVYVEGLIKNQSYWPKRVPGDLIDTHFEDKEVSDVLMIEVTTEDIKLFKHFYEKDGLCDEDNGELDETWWVRGRKDKSILHRQK